MQDTTLYLLLILSFTLYSCSKSIEGCTDPTASNYNSDAKEDDGTCTYLITNPSTVGTPTPAPLIITEKTD